MLDQSKFKFYSFAIVANNKAMSETKIQATPIESMPMLDGEIVSLPVEEEIDGQDAEGQAYQSKVTTDTAVEAEWFPFGTTNRRTPPDVRRGEEVMLFSYADTDKFYWMTTGRKDHLRKLETVIYTFSATTDEDADSTDPENCYTFEVSSHDGRITMRTTKQHKEFCEYAFQFDLNAGTVLLADDLGNEFFFDSKNTLLRLENADGTKIELDKKKIYAYAPDQIHGKAENSMLFETKDYKIETDTYTLKSDTNTIDSSQTSIKGTVEFEGAVTFKKPVAFEQMITAKGITSSLPIVGPQGTI